MSGKDYVPKNDSDLAIFAAGVYAHATLQYNVWGVRKPTEDMLTTLSEFETLADECKKPTSSKVTVHQKNEKKKALVKDLRGYVQGFVARNPYVTDHDRNMMKLPIRDTEPTPIGDPVGMVTAMINYPSPQSIELKIVHFEGTPYDPRSCYGTKIRYGIFDADAPAITEANQLPEIMFTRRKKALFQFEKKDVGKKAWFCLRYENSKGAGSMWGPFVSALIP
jgi:hypothetical protein